MGLLKADRPMRGKEAEPPLVQQQRAQCGILVLAIVSSLHHNDINTCPLPPSTLHPSPGPGPGHRHHNSSWRHDYLRYRPLFVLPGVAAAQHLSLFEP